MVSSSAACQVAALLNERYKVGDELKRSIRDDILRLIEAKTYRCARLGLEEVRGNNLEQLVHFWWHLHVWDPCGGASVNMFWHHHCAFRT